MADCIYSNKRLNNPSGWFRHMSTVIASTEMGTSPKAAGTLAGHRY